MTCQSQRTMDLVQATKVNRVIRLRGVHLPKMLGAQQVARPEAMDPAALSRYERLIELIWYK